MAAGELGGMAMSKVATAVDALFEEGVLTGEEDERNVCYAKDWSGIPEEERCYCAFALVEPQGKERGTPRPLPLPAAPCAPSPSALRSHAAPAPQGTSL